MAGVLDFDGNRGAALGKPAAAIARGRGILYLSHACSSYWPRFAPGPFSFRNCGYGGSLRGDRARLLVAAGARQPSKKLAQVVIGDERAASELARHEVSIADCGVHGISAEAGERARLRDAVRAAASLGGVLRHVCRPALGAVGLTAMDDNVGNGDVLIHDQKCPNF
jgi:hypothetical protein